MHKIKLILLLILPLSVLGQDLGIIDTKTTKNPAINGTHRISTDGKNLFFRNFFGLSRKVANTDSAVFTNGIKVNSGVNNVEIDQTQIMFRRTNGTTMTLGNYRAYSHQFFTNASFSGLTQAMSINNYGQVIVGNQILDGISNPTVKFQVGATGEARQRIISQASNATIELNGATGGNISNTTGNLNYTSAGNHVFNSKVILPDSTSIGNISSTELTYLDGVTSPIQTQLNNKAPITSPTFITDATTPRLKITGAGDVGKGSDLVMAGNSNDLTMHGTGKVILGTGGFQRLVVTNAGNVGVGTTAPVAKFEVSGLAGFRYNDGKQADGKYLRSNSTGVAAWDSVKVSEVFGLNTTYLPISNPTATGTLTAPTIANSLGANFATSSGNVGIGTASPIMKLDVNGSTRATRFEASSTTALTLTHNGFQDIHSSGGALGTIRFLDAGYGNVNLQIEQTGNTYIRGNLGVGTSSTYKGHIYGGGEAIVGGITNAGAKGASLLVQDSGGGVGNGGALVLAAGQGVGGAVKYELTDGSNFSKGDLSFQIRKNTTDTFLSTALQIKSTGNVGIGTAPTTRKLEVTDAIRSISNFAAFESIHAISGTSYRWTLNNDNNYLLQSSSDKFVANATTRLSLFDGGNIGIGTSTNAGYKLNVIGGVSNFADNILLSGGGTNNKIGFNADAVNYYIQGINSGIQYSPYSVGNFTFTSGAGNWSFTNGNVGIGTASPTSKIHVIRTGVGIQDLLTLDNLNQSVGVLDGVRLNLRGFNIEASSTYGSSDNILNLGFSTSKQITLLQNGRVGIGTTTDAGYLLDVNGSARVVGDLSISAGNKLSLSANNLTYNTIERDVTNGGILLTANTYKTFFKDNGNVGIGTTAPTEKLEVFNGNYTNLKISANQQSSIKLNTTTLYGVNNPNAELYNNYGNVGLTLYPTPTATRNDIIYYDNTDKETQFQTDGSTKLRIRGNGNVLIGTPTDAGYKLDVNGDINIPQANFYRMGGVPILERHSTFWTYVRDWSGASAIQLGGTNDPANYYNNTNHIFRSRAGAESMRIEGSGNVGIGTTSPTSKLHIEGDNSSTTDETVLTLRGNGENGKRIDFRNAFGSLSRITGTKLAAGASADDGILTFETSTNSILSEKMRITDLGNVGIGTTSPNAPLQFANNTVNRKIVLYENTNNDHDFYGFGVNSGVLRYQTGIGTNHVFYVGATSTTSNELMRIQSNGNVGIGTAIPSEKLEISGGNVKIANNQKLHFGDGANANGFSIGADATNAVLLSQNNNSSLRFNAGFSSSANNVISFTRGAGTESMRIDGSGNVGIGTNAPATNLHVNRATTSAFPLIRLETTGAGGRPYMDFKAEGVDYGYMGWGGTSNNNMFIQNYLNADLQFGTNSATRMTIRGGGNVLIGTTTDLGYKLDVSGTAQATQFKLSALNTAPASATATGTTGEIRVDANYIYICTATNTWKRSAITSW